MILVDTSIWIDHLREADPALMQLLDGGQVLVHPFILGEVALGHLKNRGAVLSALGGMPASAMATDEEVLRFIEIHALHGLGIGYINAHLLAATRLTPDARLWTRDKRLWAASERLGLAAKTLH